MLYPFLHLDEAILERLLLHKRKELVMRFRPARFDRTDFLGRFTTCERQGDKKDQRKGKAYLIHS